MEKIIFIFELENTLIECSSGKLDLLIPPFDLKDKIIFDAENNACRLFPEVLKVLEKVSDANYSIAFACSTDKSLQTKELIRLLEIEKFADITEINLMDRAEQMESISSKSGIPLNEMLYFDASLKNIKNVKNQGITTFLIPDEGLTFDTFLLAMKNASLSFDLERMNITWGSR